MLFHKALKVDKGDMVVFVGGGGKTSAMNRLAEEISASGESLILTTSTKIYLPTGLDYQLKLVGDIDVSGILQLIPRKVSEILVLGKLINQEKKIVGLDPGQINMLKNSLQDLIFLVEGDGSKGKPFKAPRDFEPVIPETATIVVPVIGIDSLLKPLNGIYFHGVEHIRRLTGLNDDDIFQAKDAAAVLLNKNGYCKGVPKTARWVPLINKVDTPDDRKKALVLVDILKSSGIEEVFLASLGTDNKIIEVF